MKTVVQYMRPYTPDELADMGSMVETLFEDTPDLVAMAVLAMELKMRLTSDHDAAGDVIVEPPPSIARLIEVLEEATPTLLVMCTKGLSREESVS